MSGSLDLFAAAEAERQTREGGAGDDGASGTESSYTVSALNRLVREFLDASLPPLWVSGEVGNWKRSVRGHCYFTLRDASAQIRCVLFQSDARRLPTEPEEGMRVRVFGSVTLYEARGDYQLVVRELEARDSGGLWRLAFERLRTKLDGEGLLASSRKRPLPHSPRRVGVVTSAVGAAFHDIRQVISQRAPWTTVVLCPARVQGDGAEREIAAAIRALAEHGQVDVIVVGRGGGSVEDLWAFNREEVARAIAESPVPVVSAVGHEVDVTIADLVADARAATPSAAAERVVLDGSDVRRRLDGARTRMRVCLRRAVDTRRRQVGELGGALERRMEGLMDRRRMRLGRAADRLNALSPLAALNRGYSVALDPEGHVLRSTDQLPAGKRFRLRVSDGQVDCVVEGPEERGDE
ncbi:MAG TPA: exodeoxyribonuclease VII large subunit [Longimicrobiales bacterium]|nr:exodeoxyribonuclease VII large subunit [Longimicrobiales bacterium]